jgi:hypothetical protein
MMYIYVHMFMYKSTKMYGTIPGSRQIRSILCTYCTHLAGFFQGRHVALGSVYYKHSMVGSFIQRYYCNCSAMRTLGMFPDKKYRRKIHRHSHFISYFKRATYLTLASAQSCKREQKTILVWPCHDLYRNCSFQFNQGWPQTFRRRKFAKSLQTFFFVKFTSGMCKMLYKFNCLFSKFLRQIREISCSN